MSEMPVSLYFTYDYTPVCTYLYGGCEGTDGGEVLEGLQVLTHLEVVALTLAVQPLSLQSGTTTTQ